MLSLPALVGALLLGAGRGTPAVPATAPAQLTAAPTIDDGRRIVAHLDSTLFSSTMRYRIGITVYKGQDVERAYRMLAFKKGSRLRLEFEEPLVERGRRALNDGDGLWMFLPRTGVSIRLAARQAFMGTDASNQDLLRLSLRDDYEVHDVALAPVDGDTLLRITLAARDPRTTYARVDLLTTRDGTRPRAQEYLAVSGRPLKRLVYREFQTSGGLPFPKTIVIENLLVPEQRTVLEYRDVERGPALADAFFTLASLRR
jgi:outer membrane lipoprotein-sorting protein